MNVFMIYLLSSVVVATMDLARLKKREEFFLENPIGDNDYYLKPKKVLGIHNVIFFPSWLIIVAVLAIIKLINRVF